MQNEDFKKHKNWQLKLSIGIGKVAQQLNVLTTLAEHQSLILKTAQAAHKHLQLQVKEELKALFWSLQATAPTHVETCIHK